MFLESARLRLRPMELADEEAMFQYHSNPDVVRYIPWFPRDHEQVRASITKIMKATRLEIEGDYLNLAVTLKSTGRLIGQVSIEFTSDVNEGGEIGYVFNPEFGGQGYATEAIATIISHGFDLVGFHRVIARTDPRNIASIKVLERLGFRQEAHFISEEFIKGEWADTLIFAVLDSEWSELRKKWDFQG